MDDDNRTFNFETLKRFRDIVDDGIKTLKGLEGEDAIIAYKYRNRHWNLPVTGPVEYTTLFDFLLNSTSKKRMLDEIVAVKRKRHEEKLRVRRMMVDFFFGPSDPPLLPEDVVDARINWIFPEGASSIELDLANYTCVYNRKYDLHGLTHAKLADLVAKFGDKSLVSTFPQKNLKQVMSMIRISGDTQNKGICASLNRTKESRSKDAYFKDLPPMPGAV